VVELYEAEVYGQGAVIKWTTRLWAGHRVGHKVGDRLVHDRAPQLEGADKGNRNGNETIHVLFVQWYPATPTMQSTQNLPFYPVLR
jgi:hypothetical protein